MEEMICALKKIGLSEAECNQIREKYRDDSSGLALFVLFMRAMFDDVGQYYE